MAVSVSKAGPYYTSGPIKFSDLRRDFRYQVRKETSGGSETFNTDNGAVSASSLLRNIITTETNPIVPDCQENSVSGPLGTGVPSSQSNWKISSFRNTIKYYYVTLPSSDDVENFDISAQDWNSNLDKNINKFVFIDGICGSTSSSPSASFNGEAYNLMLDVYGSILGYGGVGGTSSIISGENGGDALSVTSSGNSVSIYVRNGSRIYAGGGGGEKGVNGSPGNGGTCYNEYIYQYCAGSPNSSCPSGGSYQGTRRPGCCRSTMGGGCVESVYQNICVTTSSTSGGSAGTGGDGGNGRGYNWQEPNTIDGTAGTNGGSGGGCGATNGTAGSPGGDGGEWALSGENTTNSGDGGSPGRSIFGSNYSVSGTINADTVKGQYNP